MGAAVELVLHTDPAPPRLTAREAVHACALAALSAWRATQGVYRFDPALSEALLDTPITGDVPADVLLRLPEWCVYIDPGGIVRPSTRGQDWADGLHGFFVHLDHDVSTGRRELRYLFDLDNGGRDELLPGMLRLDVGSIEAGVVDAYGDVHAVDAEHRGDTIDVHARLISMVLYLCSANAELAGPGGATCPDRPRPVRTRKGPRLFPPSGPRRWDVGVRIGAALRGARERLSEGGGGTHASPRPHVRRAHWHTYWVGSGDARRPELRWLSPMLVAAGGPEDLVATVRPVEGGAG